MTYCERAITFDCRGERLLGIVSVPEPAVAAVGVVIVVGGPQYRAGSHRQFVHLARALAAAGHAVLRFDVRGMGDSTGDPRSFEQLDADIGAAVAALPREVSGVRRVVLWGLCDGASAALLYWQATRDPAIAGLALANPWVRSAGSQARTQVRHYYTQRLRDRAFWAKLLSGRVAWSALGELARSVATAVRAPAAREDAGAAAPLPFQARMALAWRDFPGPLLLLLSGRDYTAKEFVDTVAADSVWRGALERANVSRADLGEADHTFSETAQADHAAHSSLQWLQRALEAA